MAHGRVALLLFWMRARMDFWRKQQNGDWRGLFVASREKSRIRITKEAAEMPWVISAASGNILFKI